MKRDNLLTIAARTALRVLAVMVLVFGVLIALPGCGGGDWPDEPEATATKPITPNCTQQPEVCA